MYFLTFLKISWLWLDVRNILTFFTPLSSVGCKVSVTLVAGLWRQNEGEGWAQCHPSGRLANVSEETKFTKIRLFQTLKKQFEGKYVQHLMATQMRVKGRKECSQARREVKKEEGRQEGVISGARWVGGTPGGGTWRVWGVPHWKVPRQAAPRGLGSGGAEKAAMGGTSFLLLCHCEHHC